MRSNTAMFPNLIFPHPPVPRFLMTQPKDHHFKEYNIWRYYEMWHTSLLSYSLGKDRMNNFKKNLNNQKFPVAQHWSWI